LTAIEGKEVKRNLDASKSVAQKKKWEGTTNGYGLEGRGKNKTFKKKQKQT
jgi:hypothetical protein